ncbi:hypothetical protein ACFC09_07915 [Streptomyces sp. NPDC056161]|uniref:hypothetical protein n=1 Tax=Streptomyces sp. NPDC056161 TaxID=3345732 RepID=UPI0035E30378
MTCSSGNPVLDFFLGFFSMLTDPIGGIMDMISKLVLAAAISVFGGLINSIPTLTGTDSSKDINSASQWIVVYLAVGSLVFAAIRMAIERRGDAGTTALKGIMRVVLVSGAATTVVTAAAGLSDRYSQYLFDLGAKKQLESIGSCSSGGIDNAFLMLILALLLLLAGIIQTILLYIRLGVMIVLLGTLPLAAAASMTDWGAGWWRKHVGWMVAWLLYKPAAALVMYSGSVLIANTKPGAANASERIAGIGVMLLSAVALPALLKLIVPATAALGGGGSMSGMSQAGSALASGARSIGGGSGSGGSGGRGSMGPSGASGTGGGSGSSGSSGSSGGSGPSGAIGKAAAARSGGVGATGASGSGAGGGSGASGAGRAAGAAGPVIAAATTAAKVVKDTAVSGVSGANGDAGWNK